jgi:MarR family transcriptional regulator, 2-MHQ and catechol-resistance regulon repressor
MTAMPSEPLLPLLRELASCQQAIERYSARHVRALGLTLSQCDVVASLGGADLTLRELSERTLITKGTLTGVVDRLERRGLVRRRGDPADGRRTFVELTPSGRRLLARVFPEHLAYVRRAFAPLAPARLERIRRDLANLRGVVARERGTR